jgi:flavodoxin
MNLNSPLGEFMKYVIVYWSRYGNGKKVVEYLDKKLKDKKAQTQIFTTDEANPKEMPEADYYIFSAPAEAFNVQRNMRKFMKKLEGMDEKKYGIINTHGMDRNWLGKMEKLLSKKNMVKVAEIDFKVGKEANSGDALMNGWENKIDNFVGEF